MFHSHYVTRNLIFHTFQNSRTDGSFSIFSHREFTPFALHQRQASGKLVKRPKTHLHTRGNISTMIASFGIHKFVRNARAGIYHQYVFSGKLFIGSHYGSHTIIPQRPGCFI